MVYFNYTFNFLTFYAQYFLLLFLVQAEERTRVYSNNLWAQPLPDLSGRYRDCSAAFYR